MREVAEPSPSELRLRISNYAETIAERITAKGYGRVFSARKFLLAFCASVQCACQNALEIFDMEVDVNRRPVALISANIIGPLRRPGACLLLNQADLGVPALQNDVRRNGSSNLCEPKSITIKSKATVELRDVY